MRQPHPAAPRPPRSHQTRERATGLLVLLVLAGTLVWLGVRYRSATGAPPTEQSAH